MMKISSFGAGLVCFIVFATGIYAQEALVIVPATKTAIETTVLDYIEGWQTADAPRMEAALSPLLAKRHPTANGGLENLSANTMIGYTASRWNGEKRQKGRKNTNYYS